MLIKITNILVQEGKRRHRRDCSVKTGTEIGVMDPKEPLEQQKREEARKGPLRRFGGSVALPTP